MIQEPNSSAAGGEEVLTAPVVGTSLKIRPPEFSLGLS